MKLFSKVVDAFQEWLMSFSIIRIIQPFAMYIVLGSLSIDFVDKLISLVFHRNFAFLDFFETLAYFGFTLGLLLLFLSKDLKWAPYAIFAHVFIILFPFNYFGLHNVIRCGIYIWLAILLLRFTAVYEKVDEVPAKTPFTT